jgi:hypothetical protein
VIWSSPEYNVSSRISSDCVNHEILLAKLYFCGIQGVTADWLRSYLTNRRQKVEIKSPSSTQNFFL